MPPAPITSISGEEKARTRKLLRMMRSQRRFSSRKRSDSQRSMPKACTTRMPESVSCHQLGDRAPAPTATAG